MKHDIIALGAAAIGLYFLDKHAKRAKAPSNLFPVHLAHAPHNAPHKGCAQSECDGVTRQHSLDTTRQISTYYMGQHRTADVPDSGIYTTQDWWRTRTAAPGPGTVDLEINR